VPVRLEVRNRVASGNPERGVGITGQKIRFPVRLRTYDYGTIWHAECASYSWVSKNLQIISKESQSPPYDRLAIGLTKTPVLPPLSSLLYPRSPAGAVPAGGALLHMIPAWHNLCHALLVVQKSLSIYFYQCRKLPLDKQLPTAVPLCLACPAVFRARCPVSTDIGLLRAERACIRDAPI